MGRGIQKGLRGSGVREEGWKVQGGRWPSVVTAVAGSRMCGRFLNWWPYYAPNPLRGGAAKGLRVKEEGWKN